ncbi:hypothetical protein ABNG02_13745 [Halorubrum ejinorense]|uniref:Uncharacterized protein n=1 Tax=Halorubrum ejinorense TaxID=425309 RepID=A0AAV3SR94_9EURY
MTEIDLDSVDNDPGGYWRSNRKKIKSALITGNSKTRQCGSYAYVMAAKAGVVRDLSPSFTADIRDCVNADDALIRVNTIGGIGGTLISGNAETRRLLMDSSLVSDLTSAATMVDRELSENALLALSMIALEWPSSLVKYPPAIETCVEKVASSGQRATYAALSLANVAYHSPDDIASYFPNFRMAIDPSTDGRQLAALIYCLGQTAPHQNLDKAEMDATIEAVNHCCRFVIKAEAPPALQALIIESMIPLTQLWSRAVSETTIPALVESVLSWDSSRDLSAEETRAEDQTPLSVAEAAVKLAVALPQLNVNLDGEFLLALEGATEDSTIENAAKQLRQNNGNLTVESIFEQLVVEIEHLDELISVDIDDSQNININSPGAVNRYYE